MVNKAARLPHRKKGHCSQCGGSIRKDKPCGFTHALLGGWQPKPAQSSKTMPNGGLRSAEAPRGDRANAAHPEDA